MKFQSFEKISMVELKEQLTGNFKFPAFYQSIHLGQNGGKSSTK